MCTQELFGVSLSTYTPIQSYIFLSNKHRTIGFNITQSFFSQYLLLYIIFRFIGLYWRKFYHTQLRKAIPRSMSVPTIQTVKGRVVFFRKEREKISTLKPLTVWIFAVAISPPKTGNRIKKSCPCFRLLHSNGKTVCTTSAAGGRLCGGSAPAPPTSPKEQNGVLRNRA